MSMTQPDQRRPATHAATTTRPWLAAATVVALFLAVAIPIILTGYEAGRSSSDQNQYHLVAIRRFAATWPTFDVSNYESATTPGYHILLAGVARYLGDHVVVLRAAASLFTVGLLGTLAWWTARRMSAPAAIAVCVPLVASLYVIASGAWLLPDNAGWWGVLAVLLLALRPRVDAWMLVGGGAALLALVLVRQVHLWAAAVLWLAAWLGSDPRAHPFWPLGSTARMGRALVALAVTTPAFLAVAWFYRLWGGPVPPMFQPGVDPDNPLAVPTSGGNPATPALILALVGIMATFFAGFCLPTLRRLWTGDRTVWLVLLASAAAGLVVGIAPESTFSMEEGRWSGLWRIVQMFDKRGLSFAERSPVIVGLATLGGAWLGVWSLALTSRDRWILAGAWVAFTAAQTANAFAWQRYSEPFILMMLALSAALAVERPRREGHADSDGEKPPRWAGAGPLALTALLAAVAVVSLR